MEEYDIKEHTHRFAAWAASRAASVKDFRFSVAKGKSWIEAVDGLRDCVCDPVICLIQKSLMRRTVNGESVSFKLVIDL